MMSGIFRMTIWNRTVPDELRGRLAGIEMLSYSTGPILGNLETGVVASAFSLFCDTLHALKKVVCDFNSHFHFTRALPME